MGDKGPTLAFVGAGKVAAALGRVWMRAGFRVVSVASRSADHAAQLAGELGAVAIAAAADAVSSADLTLLTVPDDAIAAVVGELAPFDLTGKGVIHSSGAQSVEVLRPLAERGAMTGSLHPAYPFADRDVSPNALRGTTFALELGHSALSDWLYSLVNAAEGYALTLRPEQKALYHAALSLTSNYAVTLYAASRELLLDLGADGVTADSALLTLLGGTLDNLRERGVPDALTGPLVRNDVGTIRAHLDALAAYPVTKEAYLALARLSLPLLEQRGITTNSVEALLTQEEQP